MKNWWQREVYVVWHAQTRRFRAIKWVIIVVAGALLYYVKGWEITVKVFLFLALCGVAVHFLFRYMSHGWMESLWLYKKVEIPFDKQ